MLAKEEAIKRLKEVRSTIQPFRYVDEAIDYAIKALEKEPCDDCVSRQAVLKINENHHGKMPNHINFEIWNEIKALPPVLPKREHGEWIFEEVGEGKQILKCSKCGTIRQRGENFTLEGFIILCEKCLTLDNFCPHCGAEMR